MRAYQSPQQQATVALATIEELSPTVGAGHRFSLTNRILAAIRDLDSRNIDFDTGEVSEDEAGPPGRLQALERAASLLFDEEGQLLDEFAFISES